jgi:hypothetical protein
MTTVVQAAKPAQSEDEKDDDEWTHSDDGLDSGRKTKKVKKPSLLGFSEAEIKRSFIYLFDTCCPKTNIYRFVKVFRRYATPWTRLDDIAAQAELSDHTDQQLLDLAAALVAHCARVLRDDHNITGVSYHKHVVFTVTGDVKSKGPTFTFGGCEVQVRQLLKCPVDMAALVDCLPEREADRVK